MLNLLSLLQLVSPALPVGAYSYSEGLENLVEQMIIHSPETLENWLVNELAYGAIRLETAIMIRAHDSFLKNDFSSIEDWNDWLSAARETAELRQQSWQMGQSLLKLISEISADFKVIKFKKIEPCNYAIAFGMAAANWQIDRQTATIGYLHSWTANFISAGVRLIPLGQTAGQRILLNLQALILQSAQAIMTLENDDLRSCSWGLSLASMNHETQYTRLFRS